MLKLTKWCAKISFHSISIDFMYSRSKGCAKISFHLISIDLMYSHSKGCVKISFHSISIDFMYSRSKGLKGVPKSISFCSYRFLCSLYSLMKKFKEWIIMSRIDSLILYRSMQRDRILIVKEKKKWDEHVCDINLMRMICHLPYYKYLKNLTIMVNTIHIYHIT